MAEKLDKQTLHGKWLHAHEEDQPGRMILKSSSQQLPPARGRNGYEFHADGRVTRIGSGPADRSIASDASWSFDPQGVITIHNPGQPDEVLTVIEHDKDRLVIQK